MMMMQFWIKESDWDIDSTCAVTGVDEETHIKIQSVPSAVKPEPPISDDDRGDTMRLKRQESEDTQDILIKSKDRDLLLCGMECLHFVGENICWVVNGTTKALAVHTSAVLMKDDEPSSPESDSETRDPVDDIECTSNEQNEKLKLKEEGTSEALVVDTTTTGETAGVERGDGPDVVPLDSCLTVVEDALCGALQGTTKVISDSRDVTIQDETTKLLLDSETRDDAHEEALGSRAPPKESEEPTTEPEKLQQQEETFSFPQEITIADDDLATKTNDMDPYEDDNQLELGKKETCQCQASTCHVM